MAQRLVRKLAKDKEKYFLSKSELTSLAKIVDLDSILISLKAENIINKDDDWDKISFYKPVITEEAKDGYSGRVGIHEVMTMTSTIRDLVMKGATSQEIEAQSRKEGMTTMVEDGIFKCVAGLTTIEEVLRVVTE
jgi:type II secretory ATPase GspE/PulE/Tfp pilus assembly ATPase PilB-like protein